MTVDSRANADFLDGDLRFLLSQAKAGTPHLIHGHGDKSNTPEYLVAAFLIVMTNDWYLSLSGWTKAQVRSPSAPYSLSKRFDRCVCGCGGVGLTLLRSRVGRALLPVSRAL